jgi:hypothetical protein
METKHERSDEGPRAATKKPSQEKAFWFPATNIHLRLRFDYRTVRGKLGEVYLPGFLALLAGSFGAGASCLALGGLPLPGTSRMASRADLSYKSSK